MTKSHAPSAKPVSRGQTGKFFDKLWHKLDALGLKAQAWNEAFKLHGDAIIAECAAVVQKYVDMVSNTIIHYVNVDRARSTLESLKACGRVLHVNEKVVATAPKHAAKKQKLKYFTPRPECYDKNGWISPQKLDDEYKFHGLVADLQAQTDDNAANPEFADGKPNACQWKDEAGNWCYATFDRWNDVRIVDVYRYGLVWDGGWTFAGVPQES